MVFWNVTLWSLVDRYQCSRGTCCFYLLPWRWRQQVLQNCSTDQPDYVKSHHNLKRDGMKCTYVHMSKHDIGQDAAFWAQICYFKIVIFLCCWHLVHFHIHCMHAHDLHTEHLTYKSRAKCLRMLYSNTNIWAIKGLLLHTSLQN
jgi:hypothetical protein